MSRALYTVGNHDEAPRMSACKASGYVCGGLIHEVVHQRNTEAKRLAALR